jgi:hypothetical protein
MQRWAHITDILCNAEIRSSKPFWTTLYAWAPENFATLRYSRLNDATRQPKAWTVKTKATLHRRRTAQTLFPVDGRCAKAKCAALRMKLYQRQTHRRLLRGERPFEHRQCIAKEPGPIKDERPHR